MRCLTSFDMTYFFEVRRGEGKAIVGMGSIPAIAFPSPSTEYHQKCHVERSETSL